MLHGRWPRDSHIRILPAAPRRPFLKCALGPSLALVGNYPVSAARGCLSTPSSSGSSPSSSLPCSAWLAAAPAAPCAPWARGLPPTSAAASSPPSPGQELPRLRTGPAPAAV